MRQLDDAIRTLSELQRANARAAYLQMTSGPLAPELAQERTTITELERRLGVEVHTVLRWVK